MLKIIVPESESYDEVNNAFVYFGEKELILEHSLVALSKWEMKWEKPFLSNEEKSIEESIDYIRCMTVNEVDDDIYDRLTLENRRTINKYIDSKATATTISEVDGKKGKASIVTSELIYYWMIALNIPFECQYWHLNRLMMLIRVCNIKNTPKKKMSKRELTNRNRALNEARKLEMNTKG